MLTRLLAPLIGLASAVILGLAFWPQLVGLQRSWPDAGVVALRGSAVVIALGLIIVLFLLAKTGRPIRRLTRPVSFWLMIFVLASAWTMWDRGLGLQPQTQVTAHSGDITVLSWNTMGDKPTPSSIAALALITKATVVVLVETTAATADDVATLMGASGVNMQVHAIAFDTDFRGHSSALLIADSLGDYRVDNTVGNTAISPSVVAVPVSGLGPTIVATHTVSPNALSVGQWRSDLTWLQGICQRPNVIVAGDFNATLDTLSGLSTPGESDVQLGSCADAALATKNAAVGTWPAWAPAWLGTPIDHVMASKQWRASAFHVLTDVNTGQADHRPIVATMTPVN